MQKKKRKKKSNKNSNNLLYILIIVLVLAAGAFAYFKFFKTSSGSGNTNATVQSNNDYVVNTQQNKKIGEEVLAKGGTECCYSSFLCIRSCSTLCIRYRWWRWNAYL
ncbi:MAG: hypothetical protein ACLT69_16580 [Intestinibacter bartlettii]